MSNNQTVPTTPAWLQELLEADVMALYAKLWAAASQIQGEAPPPDLLEAEGQEAAIALMESAIQFTLARYNWLFGSTLILMFCRNCGREIGFLIRRLTYQCPHCNAIDISLPDEEIPGAVWAAGPERGQ